MAANLPPCPASLKSIQHYLKTASEHEQRDVVVAYWSRLYAMQAALKIDRKSDEARLLLGGLMDWLERIKKSHADNDAITNDVAAQAHIENYALKLFTWADSQDRAGVFNKNVVKAFYTAGMLMDVLTTFGEQTEEIARNCKYAKWKAAYIHNCLKNGETPIPGPMESENDMMNDELENSNIQRPANIGGPPNFGFQVPPPSDPQVNDVNPSPNNMFDPFPPKSVVTTPVPAPAAEGVAPPTPYYPSEDATSGAPTSKVDPSLIAKAQKYCKFAGSALNYDDVPEAITNLEKALHLLRTGQDS